MTKPRLILIGLSLLVLLALLLGCGQADAAPARDGPELITCQVQLYAVDCALGVCVAGVTVPYLGVPRIGYLLGRHLHEGQVVRINATVRGWRLTGVRRVQ